MTATPAQRSMAGQIAAMTRWSREPDRKAAMQPLVDGFLAKFERQVDPDGVLDPKIRMKLAITARKAHMRRLALASSKARAAKTEPKPKRRRRQATQPDAERGAA